MHTKVANLAYLINVVVALSLSLSKPEREAVVEIRHGGGQSWPWNGRFLAIRRVILSYIEVVVYEVNPLWD